MGSVSRRNIARFKVSAEILYRKGLAVKEDPEGWSVLIDILYENISRIFKIAATHQLYRKFWYGFWIKFLMPKDRIVFVWEESSKPIRLTKIQQILDKIVNFELFLRIRRSLFNILTNNSINTFYPKVPDSNSTLEAKETIENYLLDQQILKLSIIYKPDFIIRLISQSKKYAYQVEEVVEKTITELLANTNSFLYDELIEHNTPDQSDDKTYERSKFLSLFFSKDNFVDDSKLCSPILHYVDSYLKDLRGNPNDPFNSPEIELYSSKRFENPILSGLLLYDWIVKTALRNQIKWHMFLQEIEHWQELIIKNMTFEGETWSQKREFPTRYFYILYEMFDTFRGWLRFVERSIDIPIYEIKGDVDKNGNAVQFAIETLAGMLKNLANSEIPEHHKIYLADMVWGLYFDLLNSKREELKGYGEHLLKEMFNALTQYSTPFDHKLFKLLICSFYKVDVIGLHSPAAFDQAKEVKQKMLNIAKENVYPMLQTHSPDLMTETAKEYLSDYAYINSDGVYIPSYFRSEQIVSFQELGVNPFARQE